MASGLNKELEIIKQALRPLKAIVWGDLALARLGVPTVICTYIFALPDHTLKDAIHNLQNAGFVATPWSLGLLEDPSTVIDPRLRKMHNRFAISWASIDRHSTRFALPANSNFAQTRVVLVSTTYINLTLPELEHDSNFIVEDNLYFPQAYILLESIAKTQTHGDTDGQWKSLLDVWAITYLWGHLRLPEDILDSCKDAAVRSWFDKEIRRYEGGLTRP